MMCVKYHGVLFRVCCWWPIYAVRWYSFDWKVETFSMLHDEIGNLFVQHHLQIIIIQQFCMGRHGQIVVWVTSVLYLYDQCQCLGRQQTHENKANWKIIIDSVAIAT